MTGHRALWILFNKQFELSHFPASSFDLVNRIEEMIHQLISQWLKIISPEQYREYCEVGDMNHDSKIKEEEEKENKKENLLIPPVRTLFIFYFFHCEHR